MLYLSVKTKRHTPMKTVFGKCRQCGCRQCFHLEPDYQEFVEWISFCMNCDGAAVFDKSSKQDL